MLFVDHKFVQIVKEWIASRDVTTTAIGIGGKLVLAYRTVTQDTCPHDAKVKMAGFKDRYECTRCQKIISYVPLNKKSNDDENENYRIIL